jgi:hypothetical protein
MNAKDNVGCKKRSAAKQMKERRVTPLSSSDYVGIRETLLRYAYAIDFNKVDMLMSCFTEDAVVEVLGLPVEAGHALRGHGHADLRAMLDRGFLGNQGHSRHWVLPVLIDAEGNGAVATTYLAVIRPGEFPATGIVMTGVYNDELVRTERGWKISRRIFHSDPQPEHRENAPSDVLVRRFDEAVVVGGA